MTTITKEWLQQTIAEFENTRDDIPFGLSDDDAKILIVLSVRWHRWNENKFAMNMLTGLMPHSAMLAPSVH
ncbi:hypothetical bacteriophage protein [Salmonella enterica subsp. enterica serovar Typhi]|nr:hypothetical bacteriophage protein [Salmonella enterica subsp. enterica serovar Typhi]